MKKIAIITFHKAKNYGAVFQVVALQRAIMGLGYESKVIDYDNRGISSSYEALRISSFSELLYSIFLYTERKRKNVFFDRFLARELITTGQVEKKDLKNLENEYDKFITGSDQVWNYLLTDSDGTYFLDFVRESRKKISYAASFGIDEIPSEKVAWYKEMLQGFGYISVREATGCNLVKKMIGRECMNDLDPVFLLDTSVWKRIMSRSVPKKKYIFVYMGGKEVVQYAHKLANEKGLSIINVVYCKSFLHPEKNVGECRIDVSPEDFLAYLYYAEYIVTGSFHATVFSIIFNKQFKVRVPNMVGSRIKDLLEFTGLQQRAITMTCSVQDIDMPVDWDTVNNVVAESRERSLVNLQRSIEL